MTLHRGKIARNPTITNVRPLTKDDLILLTPERRAAAGPGTLLTRLRDPHHRLARLIAAGLKLTEAAARAGFSYTRAHMLTKDPSFQELVASYRTKVDAAYEREIDQQASEAISNMRKGETLIAIKLDDAIESGELPPMRDLIAITSDRMDRFGYGKRQTNTNINVDFAVNLERARARRDRPTIIEGRPVASIAPQYPQRQGVPASSDAGEAPPLALPSKLVRRI